MPSSYSSNLRLELIADGEQTGAWGQTTNRNLGTLIEEAIAGISQIPLSGGSAFTLSALNGASDQARKAVLRFTGGTGTTRDIMCPTVNKVYVIDNQSSDTLKIRSTADATGVTFAPSSGGIVYSEGGVIRSVFRGTYVDTSGGTMTGKLVLPAGTSSSASLQVPHGLTPSSPQNGDIWTTTTGIYVRLDGSTYRLATESEAKRYACSASAAVGQTITTSVATVSFAYKTDPDGLFSSNTFTAPVAGLYALFFTGMVFSSSVSSKQGNISLGFVDQTNGYRLLQYHTYFAPYTDFYSTISLNWIANLSTGNTIRVRISKDVTVTNEVVLYEPFFSVALVR